MLRLIRSDKIFIRSTASERNNITVAKEQWDENVDIGTEAG